MIRVSLTGDKALAAQFKALNAAVQTEIREEAIEAAAEKLAELGAQAAPRLSGTLSGSIMVAGEGPEKREIGPKDYKGRWTELGTGPRSQKATGRYTGRAPEQPYMRPSADDARVQEAARDAFARKMKGFGAI